MAATAVTPTGVRDGDPDALAGLCDVRGPAVLAYCEVVAGRGECGAAAAAEALGIFRAWVVVAGDLDTLNPEALLISATRHAAARRASGDVPEACARVPGLLAARADRSISLADHDWLDEHLASCWTCRAPVARFKVADKAYSQPPDTPLPPDVKAAMLAAMTAAAPIRREPADAPALLPAEPAHATNGSAPHAAPESDLPPEEPYTAYDMPAVQGDLPTSVEQPTSAYVMPAEDLAQPEELSDGARRTRRERTRRRRPLLGSLGPGASAPGEAPAAPKEPGARRSRRGTAAASAFGRRGARGTAAPAADTHEAHAPGAPDPRSAGGAALPRARRELSRRPAGDGRARGAMRPAVVLPVALVVIAIIVALAIAGVFGGGEPESVPQSFAPAARDAQTSTQKAPVVVVPGAAAASAAAVEKAKARARAAKNAAAAKEDTDADTNADAAAPAPAAGAPPPPAAAATPPPPPPPPPARNTNGNGSSGGKPKIDAGNGATGAEQLPPAKDTSTVPDLAPPVEPVAPPPG